MPWYIQHQYQRMLSSLSDVCMRNKSHQLHLINLAYLCTIAGTSQDINKLNQAEFGSPEGLAPGPCSGSLLGGTTNMVGKHVASQCMEDAGSVAM